MNLVGGVYASHLHQRGAPLHLTARFSTASVARLGKTDKMPFAPQFCAAKGKLVGGGLGRKAP